MQLRSIGKRKAPLQKSTAAKVHFKVTAMTVAWLSSLIGIAIVTLFAFAAGAFAWREEDEANRIRQLEGVSAMVARDVETRVAALQEQLRAWGSDAEVRKAFLAQSLDDLRTEAKSLMRLVPNTLGLRLVKLGVGGNKDLVTEPLSFAGLDLVEQAKRQRGLTQLEVHRLGSPEEHLAIAAPVFDEQGASLLGVVHIALPTSLLPSVENVGGAWGRMGFQQRVGKKTVSLAPKDGPAMPPAPPDLQVPIQGTSLSVAVWYAKPNLDGTLALGASATYLALMALIGMVLWFALRRLSDALVSDYSAVVNLVDDALKSKPARRVQYRLAETESAIAVLTGLLDRLQPIHATEPSVPENKLQIASEQMLLTASTAEEEEKGQAPQAAAAVLSEGRSGTEPIPAQIFRAYDIRGIVDEELTAPLVHDIGRAVGTEAREAGDQTVIVGRDTRPSGKVLLDSLVAGLRKSGCDVLDLGVVPTPLVYFTTHYQGTTSGVMVTASHNPVNYSGLKIVVGGATLDEERISELRERILSKSFSEGDGKYRAGDLIPDYVDHVAKDVAIARTLKVVVDCGNAAAAVVAPQLYHALGCDLVELDCDPSAGFPDGRVPDPTRPECLEALQYAVVSQGADLGLAFDADGDSLGIVDSSGKIIWPDRVLMLLAADVLSRHPGTDVVFDVNSSHHLASEILRHSGRPVMWKSGHGPLKAKLRDTGALIGGERSGHIIFRERWFGFDDALYSGARLLEVLALDPRPSAEVFATLPEALSTPEFVLPLVEGESTRIMKAVIEQAKRLKGFDLITVDGLRVESEQSWGLVRASNTQPALSFRFEAEDEVGLSKIQYLLRRIMERAAPELELPF